MLTSSLAPFTSHVRSNFSIEFCGGTHLTNTAQAEDFVIVEESGIAKVNMLCDVMCFCVCACVEFRRLYFVFVS